VTAAAVLEDAAAAADADRARRRAEAAADWARLAGALAPGHRVPDGYVGATDLCERSGLTYRRVDYWTRQGYLSAVRGTPGSGWTRIYPLSEVAVARRMRLLVDAGMNPEPAARAARAGGGEIGPGVRVVFDRPADPRGGEWGWLATVLGCPSA
jgi:hypothetical protein